MINTILADVQMRCGYLPPQLLPLSLFSFAFYTWSSHFLKPMQNSLCACNEVRIEIQ